MCDIPLHSWSKSAAQGLDIGGIGLGLKSSKETSRRCGNSNAGQSHNGTKNKSGRSIHVYLIDSIGNKLGIEETLKRSSLGRRLGVINVEGRLFLNERGV